MSCEIRNHASFSNLDKVQEYFGLSSDKSWLNGVHISHFHDTFCFGYSNKLIILSSRWQKEEQQNVFSIDWRGELDDQNHLITSILAYPINGGSNYLDWTCILIGLSSGSILFYSDTGSQLHQQSLHTQPVYSIKACYNEEIYVSFNDCVITVPTLYLVPILKNLKESINKPKLNIEEYLLNFKKWEFKNKDLLLNDSVLNTQQSICAFDHLLGESLEGGFNRKYRNTPSQSSVVVTTGTKPFVSVHQCREGFKQNGITDVAKALVSKVTSTFLPNWLSGAQSTSQAAASAANMEIASEFMLEKHELIDYQRQGCNIWMSPQNYNLAVVADSVGRIILLDVRLGIMIRMWKGYREVQCGFIEVTEPRNKKDKTTIIRRTGLFLIIYAPKKSIIEIWSLQRGPKVATFAASRSGYLIYNVHGTPDGTNHSQLKSGPKNSCFFFDLEDNMIKEFLIPFHCTLSESNSKNAEDFYFLKKLKLNLKTQNFKEPEDILDICRKFQTNEIKIKCLELLTSCKKIDPAIIKQAIEIFLVATQESEDNQLLIQCKNYEKLIDCYINARTIIESEKEAGSEKSEQETIEKEVDEWELSETELNTIQKLMDLVKINKVEPTSTKFVTFEDSEENIVSFLGSFHVGNPDGLIVNSDNFNAYETIGSVLFSNYWSGKNTKNAQLLELLKESHISCSDIMNAFLHFWLQKPLFFEEDEIILQMNRFRNILQVICEYAGDQIDYAYNSISLFWQSIREFFLECENPISALLASIVCKNYSLVHQKSVDKFESSNWEEVSQEECQWTLLISKLDDVAVLAIFVSSKCESSAKLKFDQSKITLKKILNGGTGIISELVAKWLIGSNINVDLLFYDEKIYPDDLLTDPDRSMLKKLDILKEHFPFSMNSSMLVCHIVWELMCHWSKNLMDIGFLKDAIGYLALIPESHAHFQHGLCVLMWNSQFRILLKSTKTIINKTGRLPKEKFCLQDIGISDTLVPSFLEHTIQYLDCFLSSAKHSKIDIKFEEILQNGEKSLCELILQQRQVNLDLLKLHHELVSTMELIASLNIKYPKPIQSVFDAVAYESFFVDLTKSLPYALRSKADEIRQNTRTVFLNKAISASVELIFEDLKDTFINDHVLWVGKIKKLAVTWKLEIKPIDRHHIIQLYVFGWDDYAEELLEKFHDRDNISTYLLEIAGQRLNLILQDNRTVWTRIASGGPILTNYLESLGKRDDANIKNVKKCSIDRLVKLGYRTYQMSSSSNNDSKTLRVAGQLYDVCVSLKEDA